MPTYYTLLSLFHRNRKLQNTETAYNIKLVVNKLNDVRWDFPALVKTADNPVWYARKITSQYSSRYF